MNSYEQAARGRKVATMLLAITPGVDAAANARVADKLAAYTQPERDAFANGCKVNSPSPETWTLLCNVVRVRANAVEVFELATRRAAECNADLDHPCDSGLDEDGEPAPCPGCAESLRENEAYWRRQWEVASPAEKDPQRYAREMRECGRGHLLREDER